MIKYFCKNCNINVESSECSVCGARTEVESKLYWCSTCNLPVYDEVCPICGCKAEYFTSDARPVFPEERLLIEIMLGKPFCFIEDSVWNGSDNIYYTNGKKILLSVTNLKNLIRLLFEKSLMNSTRRLLAANASPETSTPTVSRNARKNAHR